VNRPEPEPLYRRALLARAETLQRQANRSARARLALQNILLRAGEAVSLTTIHTWSRAQQGQAYLWAVAFLAGREDLPAPEWVKKNVD
jgi:hypothetical protein